MSDAVSEKDTPPAVEEEVVSSALPIDETTTQEQFSRILGGRYELKEMLGRGGMGVVYRAYDQGLKMDVAVKFLLDRYVDDPDAVESLKREAKAAMQLAHPNIVRLYNFEDTPQAKYVLMEFIVGESLASIAARKPERRFTEAEVINYISKTCEALMYAHSQGIVHRDIKPSNIIVSQGDQVKLADFGIAHIREAATSQAKGGGTPVYMSPEQVLNKETDARTDIYSLGITMYEMLAGEPPFRGPDVRNSHIHATPKPIGNVTEWMNAIVLKCLRKEPDARWASAEELRDVLTRRKEIEVGFQTVFRPAWTLADEEKKMALPKEPVPEVFSEEEEAPPRERKLVEKKPSSTRSSGAYRRLQPEEVKFGPTHLAPEREQARMGLGLLAGLLGGAIFAALDKSASREGFNVLFFQLSWIVNGGLIGIAIGIAQQKALKGMLSLVFGLSGGFGAALVAGSMSGLPSVENLGMLPYCLLCGTIMGAFLGIADGLYEISFTYTVRCFLWGALGGIFAVAAFVVIRFALVPVWKPLYAWIILGGTLGLLINVCLGSAKKPLHKSPKPYGKDW